MVYIAAHAAGENDAEKDDVAPELTDDHATWNTDVPVASFSSIVAVASRFGNSGKEGAGVVVVVRDNTKTVTSAVPVRGGVPPSVAVTVRV